MYFYFEISVYDCNKIPLQNEKDFYVHVLQIEFFGKKYVECET